MPLPPNLLKATIMFDVRNMGFSESFFWIHTGGDLNNALSALDVIAQKRCQLLGLDASVKAFRVSFETDGTGQPVLGDSKLRERFLGGNAVETCDEQDAALLVRFSSVNGLHHRNMFLRGIWDAIDSNAGVYLESYGTWLGQFNSWVASMLARGVGWVHSIKLPKKAVTGYTSDPGTGQVNIVCAAGTFGSGPYKAEMVRFSKINSPTPSKLNGQILVTPVSDTTCVTVSPYGVLPYVNGGFIQRYDKEFLAAQEITGQKIATRRVGAPLLESVGRRKAQAKG